MTMGGASLLELPVVRSLTRRASDWIDLQWSLIIQLLKSIAPQARGRLLDVGCGDKPYEAIFRPYVRSYFGIEHTSTFVHTAARKGVVKPDLFYSGPRLPIRDGSCDTVLSVQVLEHTPRPAALVAEMARVLAPDGLLILSAPFQFRLHEEPHDYFRYSPHGLRHLLADAGLEVTEMHQQGSLGSVIGHKLNSFLSFRVARVAGMAQGLGKLGHEQANTQRPRFWTFPFVAPALVGIAAGARALDSLLFDPEETMGFMVLARHRQTGAPGAGR